MDAAGDPDADRQATTVPPDGHACWQVSPGPWRRVPGLTEAWAQAATVRSVSALTALHAWRLADTKAAPRLVQWAGTPGDSPVLCLLTVTARDPGLQAGEPDRPQAGPLTLTSDLGTLGWGAGPALPWPSLPAAPPAPPPRWAGAVVRLPGTWLPGTVLVPAELRDVDDPAPTWRTESDELDGRYRVYAAHERTTAALLTPRVMAQCLDLVPRASAVTVTGDALQVWWRYDDTARDEPGRVQRTAEAAAALAEALPRFVLTDNPDLGGAVEDAYAARAAAAAEYRRQRAQRLSGRSGASP